MAEIVVDPAQLSRTARRLTQAGSRLAGVSRSLARADAGGVGSPGLAGALEDVAEDWRRGLSALGDAAAATGGQLAAAARAYADVDRAVADACR